MNKGARIKTYLYYRYKGDWMVGGGGGGELHLSLPRESV